MIAVVGQVTDDSCANRAESLGRAPLNIACSSTNPQLGIGLDLGS